MKPHVVEQLEATIQAGEVDVLVEVARERQRYPIKLVRDRIHEAEPNVQGGTVEFWKAGRTTRLRLLKAKLMEEVAEYLIEGGKEELADILEVVECLPTSIAGSAPSVSGRSNSSSGRNAAASCKATSCTPPPLPRNQQTYRKERTVDSEVAVEGDAGPDKPVPVDFRDASLEVQLPGGGTASVLGYVLGHDDGSLEVMVRGDEDFTRDELLASLSTQQQSAGKEGKS